MTRAQWIAKFAAVAPAERLSRAVDAIVDLDVRLDEATAQRDALLAAYKAAAQWLHDNNDGDEPLRQVRAAIRKAEA